VATFLGLFLAFTDSQAAATLSTMRAQWGQGFPPLGDVRSFAAWLVTVHTGGMFAYPCGGERGASTLTLVLFVTGAVELYRRGRGTVASVCVGPFAVAFVAAALRRYPYGGVAHGTCARVMQYLAPGVCLLVGVGAAAMMVRVGSPGRRARLLWFGLIGLVVVGVVPVVSDAFHPQRTNSPWAASRFACAGTWGSGIGTPRT
jgi:hypothetical protein